MRGGLELEFEGTGITIVLLTLIPQVCEATTVAIISKVLFGLPWTLCFANGFCLGAVSPAVLVPSLMILIEKKLGAKKSIPMIMLAASSFDDIVAITVFAVLVSITFDNIPGSNSGNETNIGKMIGMNVLYIVVGIAVGSLLGLSMLIFNYCKCFNDKTLIWIKFFLMLGIAIITPYVTHLVGFEESKYVGIIFYGYVCFRVWGKNKPDVYLGILWKFCGPLLFGTIGASV